MDKASRDYDIDFRDDFNDDDKQDPKIEFEKKYNKLLSTGDYYIFDIASNQQKIADVGHSTLRFLQSYAKDRYTQPYKDEYGEVLLVCLSEEEILEISKIMNIDDDGLVGTNFD
ncbi:hypothetical protein [Peribacillus butanolivorans]|uniref:hypothetical protein n=1 Tax=Peribacillus butanolivorans TaxID=421767 RepID=UPI0036D9C01B